MRRLLLLAPLLAMVLLGCARDEARPSGVTERWLQAVGDIGRKGLGEDARERAADHGDPALIDVLRPADPPDDEAWFADLEVGKASVSGDRARVAYRLTAREGDDDVERGGTAVLQRRDSEWRVTALDDRRTGEEVPSEGGARPASASSKHWLSAVAFGIILTVVSALIIEAQPRTGQPASTVQ